MDIIAPWRAVSVTPRAEIIVSELLDKRGFVNYCPRYRVILINRGHRREIMLPFISSYIFVRFGYDAEVWHEIMEIIGVSRILLGQVAENEIAKLRHQVGDDTGILSHEIKVMLRRINIGDRIVLNDGAFVGQAGVIASVDDDSYTVGVNISLLGREMVLNQPLAWCETDATAARVGGERIAESSRSKRRKRRLRSRKTSPILVTV